MSENGYKLKPKYKWIIFSLFLFIPIILIIQEEIKIRKGDSAVGPPPYAVFFNKYPEKNPDKGLWRKKFEELDDKNDCPELWNYLNWYKNINLIKSQITICATLVFYLITQALLILFNQLYPNKFPLAFVILCPFLTSLLIFISVQIYRIYLFKVLLNVEYNCDV